MLIAASAGNTRYERHICAGDDSAQVLRFEIACGKATATTLRARIFTEFEAKDLVSQISVENLG